MNKKIKYWLQGILAVVIILGFIYVGTRDFTKKVIVDSEKFDQDYVNVSKDNVFKYVNAQDVYTRIRGGDAIIFMGFPQNKWSGYYANILNETAKEVGINEILYYDFYSDRIDKNATYQSIVLALANYLVTNDLGVQNINAPTLVIIKDGKIIGFDNETAFVVGTTLPEEYWDEYQVGLKKNTFKTMFLEYLK